MRYVRFITAISLLLSAANAFACGPFIYSPSEYYLFHLVDLPDRHDGTFNLNSHENCLLWQQETSALIPLDDIYQLVYKYDLEILNSLKSGKIPRRAKRNAMARWLVQNKDKKAIDFLILAKNCEWLRDEFRSPWYYPSKKDPVRYSLNDVAMVARQKTHGRFAERYALQAVRAMTSLNQYEEIVAFWKRVENRISEGLMRRMTLSYVAGAYVHLDDIEQAKWCYKQANDIQGLLECDLRYQPEMSRVEKMELLYENYPDCPEFRVDLWQILGHVDPDRRTGEDWFFFEDNRKEILALGKLCDKVLDGNLLADKALWAYAATYIAHLQGDDKKADRYLKTAESVVKDPNLADAIKVMRIYIDAQICTYNKVYEQKLFGQLRWLQQRMEKDIEETANKVRFYDLTNCFSFYYWNDAMRCILLGTVCPKMIEQGNTTLALQLANMASYSFLKESDINLYDYRRNGSFNEYDYCCHLAEMADSLSADALIAYANIAMKPRTEFQRFLCLHSYIDSDYLNELIGTHCLREMRYAEAERYFMKVSSDYTVRTNTYKDGYLNRDPFSVEQKKWKHGASAKLHFARQMRRLEQDIADATDPNEKAMMMIDFGIGFRNSFDYCWALTQYRRGWVDFFQFDWEDDALTQQAMERADKLFSTALKSFTDDEYAARAQLLFCNYKTVNDRYPETLAGRTVKGHCDRVKDYHAERFFF